MTRELFETGGLVSAFSAVAYFALENVDQILSWLVPLTYRVAPKIAWLNQNSLERAIFVLSVVLVVWRLTVFVRSAYERIQ